MVTTTLKSQPMVKIVGANGQISLGKKYAGRQVLVEEKEPGVWTVRTATVIPDNERWLHQQPAGEDLQNALDWSASHDPQESSIDLIREQLNHD